MQFTKFKYRVRNLGLAWYCCLFCCFFVNTNLMQRNVTVEDWLLAIYTSTRFGNKKQYFIATFPSLVFQTTCRSTSNHQITNSKKSRESASAQQVRSHRIRIQNNEQTVTTPNQALSPLIFVYSRLCIYSKKRVLFRWKWSNRLFATTQLRT